MLLLLMKSENGPLFISVLQLKCC